MNVVVAFRTQQHEVAVVGLELREPPPRQDVMYLCVAKLFELLAANLAALIALVVLLSLCIAYPVVVVVLVTALTVAQSEVMSQVQSPSAYFPHLLEMLFLLWQIGGGIYYHVGIRNVNCSHEYLLFNGYYQADKLAR